MNNLTLHVGPRRLCFLLIAAASLAAGHQLGESLFGTSAVEQGTAAIADLARVQPAFERSSPPTVSTALPSVTTPVSTARGGRTPRVDTRRLALARLELGRELLAAGDFEAGYQAYVEAVELHPSAETHAALGGLYFRFIVRDKAYIQFRKAVELDPYNADLLLDLANAQHQRTALGQEWDAIRRARDIDPEIQIARDESGYYYRAESDPKAFTSSGSYTLRRIP